MALTLTSTSFTEGGPIPVRLSCEGEGVSPALAWNGLPAATKSVALVVDDPDSPDPKAQRSSWVHWVAYDIPPGTGALAEGGPLPADARDGRNDLGQAGYVAFCPPAGRHRYVHTLYALDAMLGDLGQPSKAQLETAMRSHVLAEARLVGTYEKGQGG